MLFSDVKVPYIKQVIAAAKVTKVEQNISSSSQKMNQQETQTKCPKDGTHRLLSHLKLLVDEEPQQKEQQTAQDAPKQKLNTSNLLKVDFLKKQIQPSQQKKPNSYSIKKKKSQQSTVSYKGMKIAGIGLVQPEDVIQQQQESICLKEDQPDTYLQNEYDEVCQNIQVTDQKQELQLVMDQMLQLSKNLANPESVSDVASTAAKLQELVIQKQSLQKIIDGQNEKEKIQTAQNQLNLDFGYKPRKLALDNEEIEQQVQCPKTPYQRIARNCVGCGILMNSNCTHEKYFCKQNPNSLWNIDRQALISKYPQNFYSKLDKIEASVEFQMQKLEQEFDQVPVDTEGLSQDNDCIDLDTVLKLQ